MITLYCCSVNSAQHFHLSHTCFLRAAFHSFPLTSSRRLGDRCTISFIDLLLVRSTKAQVSERTCVDLIAAYDESLNSQCSNRSALHRKTPIAFRNRSSTGGDRLTNCTIVDRSVCWCTEIDMGFQTKANKQEERTRPDDVYEYTKQTGISRHTIVTALYKRRRLKWLQLVNLLCHSCYSEELCFLESLW